MIPRYLIVYGDVKPFVGENFSLIHISNVNHIALIGKRYMDVFISSDTFPTEEQFAELRSCIVRK